MHKVDDYVMYKKDVCKIREIRKNKINGNDYYILVPVDDDSLVIEAPVENRMGFIREIISKKDAEKLIKEIPNIEPVNVISNAYIDKVYKELLYKGTYEDLIRIIKTAYLRNDERAKNKKKLSDKDSTYFNKAEKYLYNELSISLGMNYNETKEYVINKVQELIK